MSETGLSRRSIEAIRAAVAQSAAQQGLLGAAQSQGPSSPLVRPLPNPSAVGPSSPYIGPMSSVPNVPMNVATGPSSAWPRISAVATPVVTPGPPGSAASRAAGVAGLMRSAMSGNPGGTYGPPKPMRLAARDAMRPRNLIDGAKNNVKGGGLARGLGRAGGAMAVGLGANALDESDLLGGSESKLNDSVSKVGKWGSLGFAIGGPWGAAAGVPVGLIHEGLERHGILGEPTKTEQIDTLIGDAETAAAGIGVPANLVDELRMARDAEMAFLKEDDLDGRLDVATRYNTALKDLSIDYATNPEAYAMADPAMQREAELANQLIMQSVMIGAVKPYADGLIQSSNAQAQALENMAGGAGNLAPMYQQMAEMTRASAARNAAGLISEAQITPYQMALQQQSQYLQQASQNIVSQAMSQAMGGGQGAPAAGSQDLTALIDNLTTQYEQPQG